MIKKFEWRNLLLIFAPLFWLMFWWSMKVQGIEPKNGEKLYNYKWSGNEEYRKRRGYLNFFARWKKIPRISYNFRDSDVTSFYPHVMITK